MDCSSRVLQFLAYLKNSFLSYKLGIDLFQKKRERLHMNKHKTKNVPRWQCIPEHSKSLEAKKRRLRHFGFYQCFLTFKEESMVKSEILKRSTAYDFIQVGFTNETCRSKNKRDRGTLKFDYHCLTLKRDQSSTVIPLQMRS